MTEEAAGTPPTHPATLLVQAVLTLPPADRDRVLAWLLRPGGEDFLTGMPPQLWRSVLRASPQLARARRAGKAAGPDLVAATGQQMVPVRFPADQHAQLRDWCAEHGFSMAVVIRGLVTRFLEQQSPAPGQE